MELTFKGNLRELVKTKNIADLMDEADVNAIGLMCRDEFLADKAQRAEWEEWYAEAMELALQVMKEKSYPWPNCANVKFPLLTIAALNFHAKAYPSLINGEQVVTYIPQGSDPDGKLMLRATRVTNHQNYMLLRQTDWEEQTDKALINTPIMGCSFKKVYFDTDKGKTISKLVLATDLVVPYFTSSLETCPRISEMMSMPYTTFETRKRRKQFRDIEYGLSAPTPVDATAEAKADAQKTATSGEADFQSGAPIHLVEQHRYLDLDGDGYPEPYIVTFIRETGQVCRIVARFTWDKVEIEGSRVIQIIPTQFYKKMPFIPSPDGGFYDLGFGMLLGPLNETVNSLINQLLDAGSMHNQGGGFIGRGVRIKKGDSTFVPNEWKSVDSPGISLKENIVPLPVRNPSQVLLDLLTYLVQYAERISSANEVQMGELPGQNVKAETMAIANANGLRVFAAIYKRWWRAMREEFELIYQVTARNANVVTFGGIDPSTDKWFEIEYGDYSLPYSGICPIADPNIASPEQEQRQARAIMEVAMNVGGHDMHKVTMRYYKALKVPRPEELYPDPKGPNAVPAPPNPKVIEAQTKASLAQLEAAKFQASHAIAVQKLLMEVEESQARIIKLYADAQNARAQAEGQAVGHTIALIDAQIAAEKGRMDSLLGAIKLLQGSISGTKQSESSDTAQSTGNVLSTMAGAGGNQAVLSLPTGQTTAA